MNGLICRGEIYYIEGGHATGSEQYADRPGIIVSNDLNNRYSKTFEVVLLTTKDKRNLPTHVRIESAKHSSVAICEQIMTVALERVGRYIGKLTVEEQAAVDLAMMVSVALCPREWIAGLRYLIASNSFIHEEMKSEE